MRPSPRLAGRWPAPRRRAANGRARCRPDRARRVRQSAGRRRGCGVVELAVGIGDDAARAGRRGAYPGDHVLVAGPSRSGRSTALATIAATIRVAIAPGTWIGAVAPRRSPLQARRATRGHRRSPASAGCRVTAGSSWTTPSSSTTPTRCWPAVLARADPGLCVVVAGRADALRAGYGHWTQLVRRSRLGCSSSRTSSSTATCSA